jgi:DNA-binding transcriptional MerR regulator/methylmalonyl-CoA mutase cobalamin-binding subunit
MKAKRYYTMKYVSRLTGLKPHVIRAWEGRYKAVVPTRTPTNRRVYCQSDIQRLRLLKSAVDAGHAISQIANAADEELRQILPVPDNTANRPITKHVPSGKTKKTEKQFREACIRAVIELNIEVLERVLAEAAVCLTRQRYIEEVIVPMFARIGELWSAGRLKIINEQIASNHVRPILWDMLRSVEIAPHAPRVVIGTPSGQWHEIGALAAALASADAGWRPIYVGTNLPAEELAAAVEAFDAGCIGLSISHTLDDHRLPSELSNLRRFMGKRRAIFIGGGHHRLSQDLLDRIAAKRIGCWQDYTAALRTLADGATSATE